MITRKSLLVTTLALLLVVALSACTVAEPTMPERDVDISMDAAMEGQNAALNGMMSGTIELTEEQFSSLVTELLRQNAGEEVPVESVIAMFGPEKIYLTASLSQPVGGIDSVGLSGNVMVDGTTLKVALDEAYAGPYVVGQAVMGVISDRINDAMEEIAVLPVSVETEEGTMTINTQMQ